MKQGSNQQENLAVNNAKVHDTLDKSSSRESSATSLAPPGTVNEAILIRLTPRKVEPLIVASRSPLERKRAAERAIEADVVRERESRERVVSGFAAHEANLSAEAFEERLVDFFGDDYASYLPISLVCSLGKTFDMFPRLLSQENEFSIRLEDGEDGEFSRSESVRVQTALRRLVGSNRPDRSFPLSLVPRCVFSRALFSLGIVSESQSHRQGSCHPPQLAHLNSSPSPSSPQTPRKAGLAISRQALLFAPSLKEAMILFDIHAKTSSHPPHPRCVSEALAVQIIDRLLKISEALSAGEGSGKEVLLKKATSAILAIQNRSKIAQLFLETENKNLSSINNLDDAAEVMRKRHREEISRSIRSWFFQFSLPKLESQFETFFDSTVILNDSTSRLFNRSNLPASIRDELVKQGAKNMEFSSSCLYEPEVLVISQSLLLPLCRLVVSAYGGEKGFFNFSDFLRFFIDFGFFPDFSNFKQTLHLFKNAQSLVSIAVSDPPPIVADKGRWNGRGLAFFSAIERGAIERELGLREMFAKYEKTGVVSWQGLLSSALELVGELPHFTESDLCSLLPPAPAPRTSSARPVFARQNSRVLSDGNFFWLSELRRLVAKAREVREFWESRRGLFIRQEWSSLSGLERKISIFFGKLARRENTASEMQGVWVAEMFDPLLTGEVNSEEFLKICVNELRLDESNGGLLESDLEVSLLLFEQKFDGKIPIDFLTKLLSHFQHFDEHSISTQNCDFFGANALVECFCKLAIFSGVFQPLSFDHQISPSFAKIYWLISYFFRRLAAGPASTPEHASQKVYEYMTSLSEDSSKNIHDHSFRLVQEGIEEAINSWSRSGAVLPVEPGNFFSNVSEIFSLFNSETEKQDDSVRSKIVKGAECKKCKIPVFNGWGFPGCPECADFSGLVNQGIAFDRLL